MQETPQIRVVPNSSADDDIVIVEDGPSTSDIAKTFLQDIENLGDNILKLDQDFRQIHTALGAVDSSSSADGGRSNLQADWKKFMNTYSTLLRESRTTATKAEAYLEDFIQVVLPAVEESIKNPENRAKLQEALDNLKEFIERKDPDKEFIPGAAGAHSQGFEDLLQNLEQFDHRLRLEPETSENKQSLEPIRRDVSVLREEMRRFYETARGRVQSVSAKTWLIVEGVAGAARLAFWYYSWCCPQLATGAAIACILAAISALTKYISDGRKNNVPESELKPKQAELIELQETVALLRKEKGTWRDEEETFAGIIARLTSFSFIWGMIFHDAELLKHKLTIASTSLNAVSLNLRVQGLKKIYVPLISSLKKYVTAAHRPMLSAPS